MQPQDTNTNPGPSPVRPVGTAGAAGAARPVRPVVRRPAAVGGASAAPVTPAPEPVKDSGPSFDNGPSVVGKKERKTGWILAIILLLLIAAGGVGFGVWMWMDGNTQKEALNNQINSLQQTNNELQNKINDSTVINFGSDSGYSNPVIVSSEEGKNYFVNFMSSETGDYTGDSTVIARISISVNDGSISGCRISRKDSSLANYDNAEECNIDGVSGEVYKVIEFGAGHDGSHNNIGFIMKDGTVSYFPLRDILENNSLSIKGDVSINGFVIDAVNVVVGVQVGPEEGYSYGSYVFILNDGTYVLFDDSMLE